MIPYLAVEGGATRTRLRLFDAQGRPLRSTETAPSNPAAYGLEASAQVVARASRELLGDRKERFFFLAGIAGAVPKLRPALLDRIVNLIGPQRAVLTTDLHPLLLANSTVQPAMLAIAGTGASLLAWQADGGFRRFGGRGMRMGDEGGACRLSLRALRAVSASYDGVEGPATLAQGLHQATGTASIDALAVWVEQASKSEIAGLAQVITAAAEAGDEVARSCVRKTATRFAALHHQAAATQNTSAPIPLYCHGGLFEASPLYRQDFLEALGTASAFSLSPLRYTGPEAVYRALRNVAEETAWATVSETKASKTPEVVLPTTESVAPDQVFLDDLSAREIVARMNEEDATLSEAVAACADTIAALIDRAAQALQQEGRIVYVGAGTSGRLGVLDASECPPTFGVDPERVIGIIAGGESALRTSAEGEEDNRQQAVIDLEAWSIESRDLVIGIASSGTTPYVHAALEAAAQQGSATALIACNPACTAPVDYLIALDTGPEVLAGSTRLKAGTATKMVLNMISTGAMARSGYVCQGLMVCMRPSNSKLRHRAVRIVRAVAQCDGGAAQRALEKTQWRIPLAILMLHSKLSQQEAQAILSQHGGNLKEALKACL